MTVTERITALRKQLRERESMLIWFRPMIFMVLSMLEIILNAENTSPDLPVLPELP